MESKNHDFVLPNNCHLLVKNTFLVVEEKVETSRSSSAPPKRFTRITADAVAVTPGTGAVDLWPETFDHTSQEDEVSPSSHMTLEQAPVPPGLVVSPEPASPKDDMFPAPSGTGSHPQVSSTVTASTSVLNMSVGTRGHPQTCGPPCRFVKRKAGCKDGAQCPNCHLCFWCRKRQPTLEAYSAPLQDKPSATSSLEPADTTWCVSEGSIGHPVSCDEPCKYVKRKGGCRLGSHCTCCHLCSWSRNRTDRHQEHHAEVQPAYGTRSSEGTLSGLPASVLCRQLQ